MNGRDAKNDSIQEEALDWLLRVESMPENEDVASALRAWRRQSVAHERAWQRATRVWRLAGDLPPGYAGRADETAKFEPTAQSEENTKRRGRRGDKEYRLAASGRRIAVGAAAAAFVACLMAIASPLLLLRIEADYMTGVGETRQVMLDDGSTLHLDAESAVSVDYGPSRRTVRLLAGQAFFDVVPAPARPFTVRAEGLSVTVTGTGFGVGQVATSTSVAVQLGSVEVTMDGAGGRSARLAPGERLTFKHRTGAVSRDTVLPADVASWRGGRFVVDGMSLAELVEKLARYHRGIIWLRDERLAKRRITGVFNLNDPVAALQAAADTQDAEIKQLTPYVLVIAKR